MIENIIRGDTVELQGSSPENITDFKIRCEIWDENTSLKKATVNTGGADIQILITDAVNGLFSIYILAGETADLDEFSNIEIEFETPIGEKYTVYRDQIKFLEERITWTEPS